jgi:predicted SAM-dependent methyltransferase
MKLELGCGYRPTEGYLHQDITVMATLDYSCDPWLIDLPENSLSEVLALGVMEHLRFEEFRKTVKHVHYLLAPGGLFLFAVPDLFIWSGYLYKSLRGEETPFKREHILSTIYGWQRWVGDEHKSAWDFVSLKKELREFDVYDGLDDLKQRVERNRFYRQVDAHLYIKAIK